MDERRRGGRYLVWLMMQLQDEESGEWLAISRNMSRSGALVATAAKLVVGQSISLMFQVTPSGPQQSVEGTIVRVEANAEDPMSMWPHRVAVEFEEVVPALESLLAETVESLARAQPGYFKSGKSDP